MYVCYSVNRYPSAKRLSNFLTIRNDPFLPMPKHHSRSPHRWTREELDERDYYNHDLEKHDYYSTRYKHSLETRGRCLGRYNPHGKSSKPDRVSHQNRKRGRSRSRSRSRSPNFNKNRGRLSKPVQHHQTSTPKKLKFNLDRNPPKPSKEPKKSMLFSSNSQLVKPKSKSRSSSRVSNNNMTRTHSKEQLDPNQEKQTFIKTKWSTYRSNFSLSGKLRVPSVEANFSEPGEGKCHFGTQSRTLESSFYKELSGAKHFRKQASAKAEGLEKALKEKETEEEKWKEEKEKMEDKMQMQENEIERLELKIKEKDEKMEKERLENKEKIDMHASGTLMAKKALENLLAEKEEWLENVKNEREKWNTDYRALEDLVLETEWKKKFEEEQEKNKKLEKEIAVAELNSKKLVYRKMDELNTKMCEAEGNPLTYLTMSCFARRDAEAEMVKAQKAFDESNF